MASSACLPPAQDHLPKGGIAHSGLDPPESLINQENTPQASLQGHLTFSQRDLFFPDDPSLCQVDEHYPAQFPTWRQPWDASNCPSHFPLLFVSFLQRSKGRPREVELRNCLRESVLLLIVQLQSQMLNGAGICHWVGERERELLLSPDKNFL